MGTGTSQGVPMIACDCAVCTSADLRNQRTRASIHVVMDGLHIQVDASPEFRLQCLRENIRQLDVFILTHGHNDHITGMDDLRRFCDLRGGTALPIHTTDEGMARVLAMFPYAIAERPVAKGYAAFQLLIMPPVLEFPQGTIHATLLPHGGVNTLGLVCTEKSSGKKFAYYADCKRIPREAVALATGADVVCLDGLRVEPQLLLARISQRRMLSDPPPAIEGYEIGQIIVPALGVGGDFIHWAIANDGRQAVVMGDVCGKGVAAAMYMAFISGMLFEIVPACGSPESILRRLNRSLHKVLEPGLFVTAMAVMLEPRTHSIEIACAGHPPGLLKLAGGEVIELGNDTGLALGPESTPDIGVLKRVMATGEVLMVTTDGVEEAQSPAGIELGRDRVLEVLRAASGAADAARRLQSTITEHASSARQHDDLTVVTLERCH